MLDKDNVIKSIEKINRGIVKSNTKIKKILIAPNFFVEHRLATGDRIQAIK